MHMYDNSDPCDAYDTQMFNFARDILAEHREMYPIEEADLLCELQAKAWIKWKTESWKNLGNKEKKRTAVQPDWNWGDVGAYAVIGDLEEYFNALCEKNKYDNRDDDFSYWSI